jgi:hypothetical protein
MTGSVVPHSVLRYLYSPPATKRNKIMQNLLSAVD